MFLCVCVLVLCIVFEYGCRFVCCNSDDRRRLWRVVYLFIRSMAVHLAAILESPTESPYCRTVNRKFEINSMNFQQKVEKKNANIEEIGS